jgi:hypothetical protein
MDFANPTFEQMEGTGLIRFVLTPMMSPLLTLALVFCMWEAWRAFG